VFGIGFEIALIKIWFIPVEAFLAKVPSVARVWLDSNTLANVCVRITITSLICVTHDVAFI